MDMKQRWDVSKKKKKTKQKNLGKFEEFYNWIL